MTNIEALEYKYSLNKQIEMCLKTMLFDEFWEIFFSKGEEYDTFSTFLKTRIGQIWLNKFYGQTYLKWQNT